MLRPAPLLGLALLTGCVGPSTIAARGLADADALDCALAEATALGYAVVDAEDGVFVRARQPMRFRWGRRGDDEFDVLTATVARGQLTVLMTGEQTDADGTQALTPSRPARAEAQHVVDACTG